jgi:DNA (cytosine-5)-methyltransferase 1
MQISVFDGSKKFKIDKPIRLIELFGGYGSQHFALEYLGLDFEQWKLCEWAVKSIQAYKDAHFKDDDNDYSQGFSSEYITKYLFDKHISMNYNEPMTYQQIKRLGDKKQRIVYNNIQATHNLVDIQQVRGCDLNIVNSDKYCYIMTYSFPCQDLSSAGLGKGMGKGSGTRSGMLWEVERILDELKTENKELPQVLVMENVPEVVGTNNVKHFAKWLEKLEDLGYKNKYEIVNAIDCGVPQNRDRCFMVSILGDYYYNFPKKDSKGCKPSDIIEDNVDEKYFIGEKSRNYIFDRTPIGNKSNFATNILGNDLTKYFGTITTKAGSRPSDNYIIENMSQDEVDYYIYKKGVVEIKNKFYEITKDCENYIEWHQQDLLDMETRAYKIDKCVGTLHTKCNNIKLLLKNLKIRKLTERECFRLMGVKDDDFDNIAKNQSSSSLFHLAGDSIVVDVLMAIFKEML